MNLFIKDKNSSNVFKENIKTLSEKLQSLTVSELLFKDLIQSLFRFMLRSLLPVKLTAAGRPGEFLPARFRSWLTSREIGPVNGMAWLCVTVPTHRSV